MALMLVKGQKADVTKTNPNVAQVTVELSWTTNTNIEIDASAFLLGGDGKVRTDEDFVFYGQPASACGSVTKLEGASSISQRFQVTFMKVPSEVQKIVFSLTIFSPNQSFKQVANINLRILNVQTGAELAVFQVPNTFSEETAIVVGDLYRYGEHWKFNAVGAGFFGGLAA